jgi:hypothetical protein
MRARLLWWFLRQPGSPQRIMPAPPTSLSDPAIGHLVELTGDAAKEWRVTGLRTQASDHDLAVARYLALLR